MPRSVASESAAINSARRTPESPIRQRCAVPDLSAIALQKQLIEVLPSIAEKMPHPKELRSFQIGGADSVGAQLTSYGTVEKLVCLALDCAKGRVTV